MSTTPYTIDWFGTFDTGIVVIIEFELTTVLAR